MKKRLTRGMEGEATRGRISNGSFCLFEEMLSFLLPSTIPPPRLSARGDFSFFGTRIPFICLFQYALLTTLLSTESAPRTGHGAPLFNLTFLILFFFPLFLSFHGNRLTERATEAAIRETRATICRELSRQFLYDPATFRQSPVGEMSSVDDSTLCARGFAPRVVRDGNLILYGEERFSQKMSRRNLK